LTVSSTDGFNRGPGGNDGLAHQHDRPHQQCRARAAAGAPASQAPAAPAHGREHGMDRAGITRMAVLGVFASGAAPRALAASPAGPRIQPQPGIAMAQEAGDASASSWDHAARLDAPGTLVVSGPRLVSGQPAGNITGR